MCVICVYECVAAVTDRMVERIRKIWERRAREGRGNSLRGRAEAENSFSKRAG